MDSFLAKKSDSNILANTGIGRSTLIAVHNHFSGSPELQQPQQLWTLLQFYKNYNVFRAAANFSHGYLQSRLRKTEAYLANRMKSIFNSSFEIREERENNLSHVFPPSVSGCVDTFPIYIRRPKGSKQRMFFNGKYRGHVLKVQLVVDHRGNPIWFSGPHVGTTHDVKIWRACRPHLKPGEKLLADKAYQGEHSLLTPFKKQRGQRLTEYQAAYNQWHSWCRATVEHAIGFAKRFQIIGGVYRGRLRTATKYLRSALIIILGLCFLHNRITPHRDPTQLGSEPSVSVQYPIHPLRAANGRVLELDDESVDSGYTFSEFQIGDTVQAWWRGSWFNAKVTQLARKKQTLTITFDGTPHYHDGILCTQKHRVNQYQPNKVRFKR